MTKTQGLYCWLHKNSTIITLNTDTIDFWNPETWWKLTSVEYWGYYCISRNILVSIPTRARAYSFICHSPSLHMWQQAGEFCHQDWWHKMIYGLGRRLHLLRDSSVIPVFPGEMNLKTPVHADPVLQTVSCTDAGSEKSCRSFSFIHPNSCFIVFNTKFYPRLSQQLIKWSKKKFHTSSWPWRNPLMISLRTDVTDRWINERKEIAFAKCLHVPGIRCISTYLILKTIHR